MDSQTVGLRAPPVSLIVDFVAGDTVRDVIFSPGSPRFAAVLFEASAPRFYDLQKAGLVQAIAEATVGKRVADCPLKDDSLVAMPFSDPASFIAIHPQGDEVAVAFGDQDELVYRFNPLSRRKFTPLPAENVVSLAYSSDGSMLATGGSDGVVSVFKLDHENDEVELECEATVRGAVRSLCFEHEGDYLRIATDHSSYIRLQLSGYDSGDWERQALTLDSGTSVVNAIKLNHIACCPTTGLLGFGGIGREVWLFNPDYGQGAYLLSTKHERVSKIQFLEGKDEILVFGDGGIEVIAFMRDCFDLPHCSCLGVAYSSAENSKAPIVAGWQYNGVTVVARSLCQK
ncbi:MAG: WD40 repeat domain-containing protein [Candidatus Obscuribacterales bacterium]|nr:WD40 repeat domain-containing protein [Candidatus Obscuribacterales bacterium]